MAGVPCLVLGHPRGLTRSVLEALVKRGSPVVVACPDRREAEQEQHRLRSAPAEALLITIIPYYHKLVSPCHV